MLNEDNKKELLRIARESLDSYLKDGNEKEFSVESEILKEKMGAFVTLKNKGNLRGCIGYIIGVKPIFETVAEMAINAGTRDTRFSPVTASELAEIRFEISVLTPFEKIDSIDEIEVGKHGLYIKKGFYSGLLLPQVATEYGWDRDEFLKHVCQKAGLGMDAWKQGAEIFIFSAQVFGEEE
ncbi:MAG: AmmeMemoRadiSam system protein A [Candidatus Aureabacteria bacterium]|nr:AmmeMemoRadiSam system protein A [Candidatus Auribacterota bacterium]